MLYLIFLSRNYSWPRSRRTWLESGTQYKYQVRARSMTGLHQVADQYVGIVMKARLQVQPKSDNELSLQVRLRKSLETHVGRNLYIARIYE